MQRTNEKEFRIEKLIRKKGDKLHVKWKGYDNGFNSWIDQKTWCDNIIRAQKTLDASKRIKMSQFFPKPFNLHFGDSIKVNIDLSNYTTKTDLKNVTHVVLQV